MTENDDKKFAECMAGLQEVFTPDKPVTKLKADVYFNYFKNWSIEDFQTACSKVLDNKTISTFPLPAEIKNALHSGSSLKAWLMAIDGSGNYGAQKTVTFPDPVIHSVIKAMGGWIEFCSTPTNTWKQKEFERLYDLMLEKGDHPQQCLGLYYPENQVIYDDKKLIENSDTPLIERR